MSYAVRDKISGKIPGEISGQIFEQILRYIPEIPGKIYRFFLRNY